jgi:hypothetical protein
VLNRASKSERCADAADAHEVLDGGLGRWTHFYVGLAVLLALAMGAAAALRFFFW